jgi:hypothetical protein
MDFNSHGGLLQKVTIGDVRLDSVRGVKNRV